MGRARETWAGQAVSVGARENGASPAPTFISIHCRGFSLYCRKYRSHTAHSARYFFSTTIVLLEDISLPLFISSREGWSHYSFVLARGFSPLLRSWHRHSSACTSSCCEQVPAWCARRADDRIRCCASSHGRAACGRSRGSQMRRHGG